MLERNKAEQKTNKQTKKKNRNEDDLWDLWDNVKCPPHLKHRFPGERRQKERAWENTWGGNTLKLSWNGKGNRRLRWKIPVCPIGINPRQNMSKHTLIKIKQINKYTQWTNIQGNKGITTNDIEGNPIRITADLTTETLQFRREWQDKLKVMKGKNLKPRLLYPTRIVL